MCDPHLINTASMGHTLFLSFRRSPRTGCTSLISKDTTLVVAHTLHLYTSTPECHYHMLYS